jgi:hypothetical protein
MRKFLGSLCRLPASFRRAWLQDQRRISNGVVSNAIVFGSALSGSSQEHPKALAEKPGDRHCLIMASNESRTKPKGGSVNRRTSDGIFLLEPSTKPKHFTADSIFRTIRDVRTGRAAKPPAPSDPAKKQ